MNNYTTWDSKDAAARFILKLAQERPSDDNVARVVGGWYRDVSKVARRNTLEIDNNDSRKLRLSMIADAVRTITGRYHRRTAA